MRGQTTCHAKEASVLLLVHSSIPGVRGNGKRATLRSHSRAALGLAGPCKSWRKPPGCVQSSPLRYRVSSEGHTLARKGCQWGTAHCSDPWDKHPTSDLHVHTSQPSAHCSHVSPHSGHPLQSHFGPVPQTPTSSARPPGTAAEIFHVLEASAGSAPFQGLLLSVIIRGASKGFRGNIQHVPYQRCARSHCTDTNLLSWGAFFLCCVFWITAALYSLHCCFNYSLNSWNQLPTHLLHTSWRPISDLGTESLSSMCW